MLYHSTGTLLPLCLPSGVSVATLLNSIYFSPTLLLRARACVCTRARVCAVHRGGHGRSDDTRRPPNPADGRVKHTLAQYQGPKECARGGRFSPEAPNRGRVQPGNAALDCGRLVLPLCAGCEHHHRSVHCPIPPSLSLSLSNCYLFDSFDSVKKILRNFGSLVQLRPLLPNYYAAFTGPDSIILNELGQVFVCSC